nr:hypothetical protein [Tanacetum cinerariifolium]
ELFGVESPSEESPCSSPLRALFVVIVVVIVAAVVVVVVVVGSLVRLAKVRNE